MMMLASMVYVYMYVLLLFFPVFLALGACLTPQTLSVHMCDTRITLFCSLYTQMRIHNLFATAARYERDQNEYVLPPSLHKYTLFDNSIAKIQHFCMSTWSPSQYHTQ